MLYRRNLFAIYRVIHGVRYLFLSEQELSFELDDLGLEIWSLLDGTHNNEDIAALIAKKYRCSAEEVLSDVDEFTTVLSHYKLLDQLDTAPLLTFSDE